MPTSCDVVELRLRSPDGDELHLAVLGRTYPESTDYWDGNWLNVRFEIQTRRWSTRWSILLRAEELARFRDRVVDLHRTLKGDATFETLERWLTLTLRVDSVGHLEVRGELRDTSRATSQLQFSLLGLDQTYLPQVCSQLDDIVAAFLMRTATG
jgi:hypothetical protein